jgi:hypothetical protein
MRRIAKGVAALSLLSIMSVAAWALAQGRRRTTGRHMELMRTVVPKAAYDAMLDR